jgi:circadian clock protein KaiC
MDTWLLLRMVESNGERNRLLYVLKSRGMAHSNQVREFQLTDHGIRLTDVYLGPGQVLTGAARLSQEAEDRTRSAVERQNAERRRRELKLEQASLEVQLESLKARLGSIQAELKLSGARSKENVEAGRQERLKLAAARSAD